MDNDTTSAAAQLPDAIILTDQFHIDGFGGSPTVRDGSLATLTPGITRTMREGQLFTAPVHIAELIAHGAPMKCYRELKDG